MVRLSKEQCERAIRYCVFSFKMEGLTVPESVQQDGMRILRGEITADRVVAKYLAKDRESKSGRES
jgi:hypothetical protein